MFFFNQIRSFYSVNNQAMSVEEQFITLCSLTKLWHGLYSHNPSTILLGCNSILIVYLSHYRDPHSTKTLQVFQDAVEWACSGSFSEKDVDEAKLSVFSQVKTLRMWNCNAYILVQGYDYHYQVSVSSIPACIFLVSSLDVTTYVWQVQQLRTKVHVWLADKKVHVQEW